MVSHLREKGRNSKLSREILKEFGQTKIKIIAIIIAGLPLAIARQRAACGRRRHGAVVEVVGSGKYSNHSNYPYSGL